MKEIKKSSILARILAGENISLAVQENLTTASFDLKNRIVRIPDFMFDDDDFQVMVIGHEIAHCIYTPSKGWTDAINILKDDEDISEENRKYVQSVLNIIEDVRIDKLIQRKYPGLKKYYQRSTAFIKKNDFFKIEARGITDISLLSFVNRICIWSKCDFRGTLDTYNVKFSAEEQPYVDRLQYLETWEDVVEITKEILEKFDCKNDISLDESKEENGEGEGEGNENQEGEGEGKGKGPVPEPGRYNIDEEVMDKCKSSGEEDDENGASRGGINAGEGQTLHDIWSKNIGKKIANIAVSGRYGIGGTKVLKEIKDFVITDFYRGSGASYTKDNLGDLAVEYKKYISAFATKFNMRKRARELVNNFEKDIGTLDPLKLHKYKYDEKIFHAKSTENHQKNHGFIFLIDCSGSMADVFKSLSEQLFAFYRICERIDVPFAMYGYTDIGYGSRGNGKTNFNSSLVFYKFGERGDSRKEIDQNLAKIMSGQIQLGGTPTSDALLGIVPEIKRFENTFTPDIMNVIVVTDGSDGICVESTSLSYKGGLYNNMNSPRGVLDNNAAIYKILRDHYNVRIFHMDITNQIPASLLSKDEVEKFRRDSFLSKKEFGGANNVLWVCEDMITNRSTAVVDSLVNILA